MYNLASAIISEIHHSTDVPLFNLKAMIFKYFIRIEIEKIVIKDCIYHYEISFRSYMKKKLMKSNKNLVFTILTLCIFVVVCSNFSGLIFAFLSVTHQWSCVFMITRQRPQSLSGPSSYRDHQCNKKVEKQWCNVQFAKCFHFNIYCKYWTRTFRHFI